MIVLACNLEAISAELRPRHSELALRLRRATQHRSDLLQGYTYKLDSKTITLPQVAEWIALERLCCPFLKFQLEVRGDEIRLTLSGPEGAKAILREEFPVVPSSRG